MTAAPSDRGVEISIPADARHAALVRALLRDLVVWRDDDEQSHYLIGVSEAVVNAVEATDRVRSRAPVTVDVDVSDGCVTTVVDRAGGMPPEEGSSSGRGLAIMRAFVPALSFETGESGTTVSLPATGGAAR